MHNKYTARGLEEKVDELDGKIEKILINHLPHLQEQMIGLKIRINIMTAINIGGIILGIIVARVLR